MLNGEYNTNLVKWAEDGKSFVFLLRKEFALQLFSRYSKHFNFVLFMRHLNMHGWPKIQDVKSGSIQNNGDDQWQFKNKFFSKGSKELLQHIVRQTPTNQA
ncbi:uncharacterized protein ZBAI_06062 [Zygosaccharomyces bailii ISA1307]|nr:uncharacterized protein ZBAI_06062 [Zygosaccharomyces bailii ISA1307]